MPFRRALLAAVTLATLAAPAAQAAADPPNLRKVGAMAPFLNAAAGTVEVAFLFHGAGNHNRFGWFDQRANAYSTLFDIQPGFNTSSAKASGFASYGDRRTFTHAGGPIEFFNCSRGGGFCNTTRSDGILNWTTRLRNDEHLIRMRVITAQQWIDRGGGTTVGRLPDGVTRAEFVNPANGWLVIGFEDLAVTDDVDNQARDYSECLDGGEGCEPDFNDIVFAFKGLYVPLPPPCD